MEKVPGEIGAGAHLRERVSGDGAGCRDPNAGAKAGLRERPRVQLRAC